MKKSFFTTLLFAVLTAGGALNMALSEAFSGALGGGTLSGVFSSGSTLSAQSLPLQKYYAGLSVLPTDELVSITKAQTLYFRTFKGVDPSTCDSGYVLFEDFLIVAIDSIDFELPFKANDQNYINKLKLAGLRLVNTENVVTVKPDMTYFLSGFNPYISQRMKDYFQKSSDEFYQGFVEGDSLVISFAEVSRRVIYWDKFYSASLAQNFVLTPEVKDRLDRYMQSLIFGEPFSAIWTAEGSLREDLRNALTLAIGGVSLDATKKVLSDYLAVLESCNFSKCDKAVNFSW